MPAFFWVKKMRVLFIHEAPGQFKTIHKYINETGLGESWLMCAKSAYEKNKKTLNNLIPFPLPTEDQKSYFYTMRLESRIKRSFYFRQKVLELMTEKGLDIVVTHGSGGFPLQLFDEVNLPIVTYIEFPSFSHHGYDEKYPQPDFARFADKLFEMSSYHQVIRSDLVVVPSEYAKNMFPEYVRHKIKVQMEGFDIQLKGAKFPREAGYTYVGFTARDLSSAKGFEQFILIAKEILRQRSKVKFVFCGSPKVLYSYETTALQKMYGNQKKSFLQYILEREGVNLENSGCEFQHLDFMAYDDHASFVESMDFFVYPLQFGSANWGLFEVLLRGKIVVASDRCFVPEVIRHGFNGLLCDYERIDDWVKICVDIIDHPEKYRYLGENALQDGNEKYSIEKIGKRYVSILQAAISVRRIDVLQ